MSAAAVWQVAAGAIVAGIVLFLGWAWWHSTRSVRHHHDDAPGSIP